jgi:hypothetical protein
MPRHISHSQEVGAHHASTRHNAYETKRHDLREHRSTHNQVARFGSPRVERRALPPANSGVPKRDDGVQSQARGTNAPKKTSDTGAHPVSLEIDELSIYSASQHYLDSDLTSPQVPDKAMTFNASETTDITLHIQLETIDDLSDDLEEFSRFCRLGDFANAKQHFVNHLGDHMQNPYVCVHYAHMLYDSGDYKKLQSLEPPK